MANTTSKRGLNKPARTDYVNVITDLNDNMDNLDNAVPDSRTVNGHALSSDVTVTKADIGLDNVDNVKQVPVTRTVNGHALSSDVTVSKGDVGLGNVDNVQQVPATRKVNNKALSSDVTLYGSDIAMNSLDGTKLDAAISDTKSALNGVCFEFSESIEGATLFSESAFENGSINSSTGGNGTTRQAARARNKVVTYASEDITITATNPYQFAVFKYGSFDISSYISEPAPSFVSSATIAKGTYYRILATKNPSSSTEESVSSILANLNVSREFGERLANIESDIETLEKGIDETKDDISGVCIEFSDAIGEKGFFNENAFENGNITGTGQNSATSNNARARNKTVMYASEDIAIFPKNPYQIYIFYYTGYDFSDCSDKAGWMSSSNGWYIIPKGSYYRVLATQNPSSTTAETVKSILSNVYAKRIKTIESENIKATQNILYANKHFNTSGTERNPSGLFTMAHISDIHRDDERYKRFVEYFKNNSEIINYAICTGDFVDTATSSSQFDIVGLDDGLVMHVVGNHDKGGITTEAVKAYLMPNESATYYYKDLSNSVRLIVLDQCLDGGTSGTLGYYGETQINWLLNLLDNSIVNNKHVLIAMHTVEDAPIAYENNNSFFQRYYKNESVFYEPVYSCNGSPIISQIINAFKSGGTLTKSYTFRNGDSISINHTFTSEGTFIGYICGHTHADFIGKNHNYANQLVSVVTCGACVSADSVLMGETYSDLTRRPRTKTQDAFNVYVIDTQSKLFKVIRVGADKNDLLIEREVAVFEY